MKKSANFLVAHNVHLSKGAIPIKKTFQEIFKEKELEINMISGKSGKIKLSNKISSRETDYLHSYSFLSVAADQQNNPSENWDFMCFHDNESKTLCIGDAKSKEIDIENWSGEILKILADKKVILDYCYAYHETLAFGQGYAVGVFCEDDKHNITEFEVAEEISRWLKNSPFDVEAHKIRDVFDVNIFSEKFFKTISSELGEILKKTSSLKYLDSIFHMLTLNKQEKKELRQHLEKKTHVDSQADLRIDSSTSSSMLVTKRTRGNQKGGNASITLRWNANHQLVEAITERNGVTQTTRYAYDALGNQIRQLWHHLLPVGWRSDGAQPERGARRRCSCTSPTASCASQHPRYTEKPAHLLVSVRPDRRDQSSI